MTRTFRKIPPKNAEIEKKFLLKWVKIKSKEEIVYSDYCKETRIVDTSGFLLRVFSLSGDESEYEHDALLVKPPVRKTRMQYIDVNKLVSIEIDRERQNEFEADASGANRLKVKFWSNHVRDNIEHYMHIQ